MIYQKRRTTQSAPGGFFSFQSIHKQTVYGYGYGDYIRLRDEYGNVWRGMAEREYDDTVRYRFRDEKGRAITGVSDSYGVLLRDDRGTTWRGFID